MENNAPTKEAKLTIKLGGGRYTATESNVLAVVASLKKDGWDYQGPLAGYVKLK